MRRCGSWTVCLKVGARTCATTAEPTEKNLKIAEKAQDEGGKYAPLPSLSKFERPSRKTTEKNYIVFANHAKSLYFHPINRIATWYWMFTDFWFWFNGALLMFIGSQLFVRYKIAKVQTAEQAKLGENLLDQRTRDLLTDIETLRSKDPLRLEHEANIFHENFWKLRAKNATMSNQSRRESEMNRGLMQGVARGTDMSEWMGAKKKDDDERDLARRTFDYISGFHRHLKTRRLI